ncbi:MAG: class I tRNA ligase family protein, partial [Lachnospiraceae bacterium]|nr:class I tRNA ligase family protein [Lachnospiraceae bacterium]
MLQTASPSQPQQSQQSQQRQSPQSSRQQQTWSTQQTQETQQIQTSQLTKTSQSSCALLPIDRWIIERANETVLEASKWLDQYEIGLARKVVDEFFWKDFCDHYIELVKERLYQPQIHGVEERRSAQTAIAYSLHTILQLYAIYIPHETEYIYQKGFRQLEGAVSIHTTQ